MLQGPLIAQINCLFAHVDGFAALPFVGVQFVEDRSGKIESIFTRQRVIL